MSRRSLFAALAALALTAWVGNVAVAGDTHEGTVVSVTDTKLTMNDKDGKEHSHDIGTETKISCDGKECKLSELTKGDKLKVTMGEGKKVTKIEATRKDK